MRVTACCAWWRPMGQQHVTSTAPAGGVPLADRIKAMEAELAAARQDHDRKQAFIARIAPMTTEALYAMRQEYVDRAEKSWDSWSHDERCYCVEEDRLVFVRLFRLWEAGEYGPIQPEGVCPIERKPDAATKLGQAVRAKGVYAFRNPLVISSDLMALRGGREPIRVKLRDLPPWKPGDGEDGEA